MYIAPGQGQTTPLGQNFVNRNSLSLCPYVASLKNFSWRFFTVFCVFFPHVYSPREGQATHWEQNFYDNRKAFSLCPYVASFKMISLKSDFIHIFNDFIPVYSPGARAENPLRIIFLMSTESPYHFEHLLQVSNKSLWILILYTLFNVFPHVYSPGAGADNPLWTKSWCQQKSLVILLICCKFQKNIFEVWILYIIFHVFLHVNSPGADKPLGSEFLYKHKPFVTLVICCKFFPLNDFLTIFP